MHILTFGSLDISLPSFRFFDGLLDNDEGDELIDKGQEQFADGNTEEAEANILEGMAKKIREAAQKKEDEE